MYENRAPIVAMIAVATARRPAMPCGSACASCSSAWSCGPWTWNPCSDISLSRSKFLVGGKGVAQPVGALVRLVRGQREAAAVPRRKDGVGGELGVDLGQLQLVGERQ